MAKRVLPAKFDKRLGEALDATGLPWTIEPGTRHFKIRLAGRLCGLVPQGVKGDNSPKMLAKNVKQIRRIADEIKQGKPNGR